MTMLTQTSKRGQTMTEYIVIVILCGTALLGVVTAFGNDVRRLFFTSSDSVRKGKNQDVVWVAGHRDNYDHHLGAITPDTPYEWNPEAQRWFDPETNRFVSFDAAGEHVDDPYMYKE